MLTGKRNQFIGGIAFGVFLVFVIAGFALTRPGAPLHALAATGTDVPTDTPTSIATITPTDTPDPNVTVVPTSAPVIATNTPVPTPTDTPIPVPSFTMSVTGDQQCVYTDTNKCNTYITLTNSGDIPAQYAEVIDVNGKNFSIGCFGFNCSRNGTVPAHSSLMFTVGYDQDCCNAPVPPNEYCTSTFYLVIDGVQTEIGSVTLSVS